MARSHRLQDLHKRPGFLLKRCQQVSAAIFLEECREFNMTASQYGCLWALSEFPGIDQLTLGRLVGLDRSTVGLVVKTLCERGAIERAVDERDKRRLILKISSAGAQLLKDIAPSAARAQDRVFAGFPRNSRAVFVEMLEEFLAGHGATIDVDDVLSSALGGAAPERDEIAARKIAATRARGK